jgi:hypothetical protein
MKTALAMLILCIVVWGAGAVIARLWLDAAF